MPAFTERLSHAWKTLRGRTNAVPGPYGGPADSTFGGSVVNTLLPQARRDWLGLAGDLWRNSVVSVCLGWLQDNGPQARYTVRRLGPDGRTETPVEDHPSLDLLGPHGRVNDAYSADAFWAAIFLSFKVDGNAYAIKSRGAGGLGETRQLWWEPHWNVSPARDPGSPRLVDYYWISRPEGRYRLDPSQIIHLRDGIDPLNPMLGMARLKVQARNIYGLNAAETYGNSVVENAGALHVVWSPSQEADPPDPKALLKEKRRLRLRSTSENAGTPFFASLPGRFDRLGAGPAELGLGELLDRPEATVCAALGVHPQSVGLVSGSGTMTFANFREANRRSWADGLIPMQDKIARELAPQLLCDYFDAEGPGSRLVIRWDRTGIEALQRDASERSSEATSVYGAGLATLNEARHILGLPPVDGGDASPLEPDRGGAESSDEDDEGYDDESGDDLDDEDLDDEDSDDDLDEEDDDATKARKRRRKRRKKPSRPGGPRVPYDPALHPKDELGRYAKKPGSEKRSGRKRRTGAASGASSPSSSPKAAGGAGHHGGSAKPLERVKPHDEGIYASEKTFGLSKARQLRSYDSTDLSRKAIEHRKDRRIGRKGNVAVIEYERNNKLRIKAFDTVGAGKRHSEFIARDALPQGAILKRLFTERQPCQLWRPNCDNMLARDFPDAKITFLFEYGDKASRRRSKGELRAMLKDFGL